MIKNSKDNRELRHIARLRTAQLQDMAVQLNVLYEIGDYHGAMTLTEGSAVAFAELHVVLQELGNVEKMKGKKVVE